MLAVSHDLGQAGLLGWYIAPLLHHWLLHLPGVGPGPGAHFLGYIHTLLCGSQLGYQFGNVLAGTLWFQSTLLLRSILDNCLCFVIALLLALQQ